MQGIVGIEDLPAVAYQKEHPHETIWSSWRCHWGEYSTNDKERSEPLFVPVEVTNEKNELYPQETLYTLLMALQMYLHSKGVYHKFMNDIEFADVQNTLDNRMKCLSKMGIVAKRQKAEPFTMQEEEHMWSSGVLSDSNPEQLINTLIYLLGVHFSLRAVNKHKALKTGYYSQIQVKYDEDSGTKFLLYKEARSKNHQGGCKDLNTQPKVVSAYANKENPARCVVHLYEYYLSLRPSHDPKCLHDLYLRPLKRYTEHVWFSCQPLGINTLQQVASKLAACAHLPGRCTNHSLCATGPTRMYSTGMDDKLVRELIGHRSNAVLEYKHTPTNLKHHVSDVLYGNQDTHVLTKHLPSTGLGSGLISQSQPQPDLKPCIPLSQPVVSSSQPNHTGTNTGNVTVNYNLPQGQNLPMINVYPIVNIPQGLLPGTPIVININLQQWMIFRMYMWWICIETHFEHDVVIGLCVLSSLICDMTILHTLLSFGFFPCTICPFGKIN